MRWGSIGVEQAYRRIALLIAWRSNEVFHDTRCRKREAEGQKKAEYEIGRMHDESITGPANRERNKNVGLKFPSAIASK